MPSRTKAPFQVELTACIAGNPLKAWRGTAGPDDTDNVPNDEWQDQLHPLASLNDAKAWIETLDPRLTTHVVLSVLDADGSYRAIYSKDAGDDLDQAAPDFEQQSHKPPVPPDVPDVIEDITPMPAQGAAK